MSRRLGAQGCPQVHWRDPSKNPRACGPCGQPNPLTTNTVASLRLLRRRLPGLVRRLHRYYGTLRLPASLPAGLGLSFARRYPRVASVFVSPIGPTPADLGQDPTLRTDPEEVRAARWWKDEYQVQAPG